MSAHSIQDMEEAFRRLRDLETDYINYNPEQWGSCSTPREEIDDLEFVQKDYGVLIYFGNERFRIESEDVVLQVEDLTADDFIF